MVSSQLALHRYATGRDSRVVTALTMLKSHLFGYTSSLNLLFSDSLKQFARRLHFHTVRSGERGM
jgi:hypothetical protein